MRSCAVELSLLNKVSDISAQVVPLESLCVSSNMTKVKAHKARIKSRIFRQWCSGTIFLRLGASAQEDRWRSVR